MLKKCKGGDGSKESPSKEEAGEEVGGKLKVAKSP